MTSPTAINLIDALNYYLVLTFVVGTILRVRNYRAIIGMVYRFSGRWPKLRVLVGTHRGIFLRWPTVLPVLLTLGLLAANAWVSHFVWVDARVTPGDLWAHPLGLAAVAITGGLMGFLDFRSVFLFGRFDRAAVEAELDRAEHWLGSWKAPAIRFFTAGLVNPRRLVGEQVREALVKASLKANGQLWEMCLQIAARIAFGLALWITWAAALR
ncbi:MAG TPA: hypothetical protein VM529_13110 [Gemmata sp.]|jgi:hypothetical protein|nr:hypothetical protein [Gemmata sp.]